MKIHHPYPWDEDLLFRCHFVSVRTAGSLIALCWVHPVYDRGAVEVHLCADAAWHGRWLTRPVLDALFSLVDVMDAKFVIAQVTGPLIERIWRRLGFTILGPLAVLEITEVPDGNR